MHERTDADPPPLAGEDREREPRAGRVETLVTYAAVLAVIAAAVLAAVMHDVDRTDQGPSAKTVRHARSATAGREPLAPTPHRNG